MQELLKYIDQLDNSSQCILRLNLSINKLMSEIETAIITKTIQII